ncbi:MAG: site-specific integrase [Flavobacteriaceae bacterium]|nr:site-specific integrase [Flavobacteriaceae bacterium]
MKTSKTFKILIWQNTAKRKNNLAPIYARITVNGKRAEISLSTSYSIDSWDSKMSRAIGRSATARVLNEELDTIFANITNSYKELLKEDKHITAQSIKARYLKLDNNQMTLLKLDIYHASKMEGVLAKGTLKNYKATTKYITAFLNKQLKMSDISLQYIRYNFILEFEQFLRNKKNNISRQALKNNGIMKHLERLNKLMNLAVKLEWIEKNPFLNYDVKYTKYDRPFSSAIELQQLEDIVLHKKRHILVRDIFIFACYTGLSYIDLKNLTKGNLVYGIDGKKWLYLYREKSSTPVKIPLLYKALSVLEKYNDFHISDRLLPVYSNHKMNTYIKEVAVICGITKNLTCHVARHTFATTVALSNGVPIETLSKLLGHSKLSTTQIYARVLDDKIGKDVSKLQDVLNTDERNAS